MESSASGNRVVTCAAAARMSLQSLGLRFCGHRCCSGRCPAGDRAPRSHPTPASSACRFVEHICGSGSQHWRGWACYSAWWSWLVRPGRCIGSRSRCFAIPHARRDRARQTKPRVPAAPPQHGDEYAWFCVLQPLDMSAELIDPGADLVAESWAGTACWPCVRPAQGSSALTLGERSQ